NMFGVTHNSTGSVMPTNSLGMMKQGNNARVINAKVGLEDRGKGIGKELYKTAIEQANAKGLNFVSDTNVSDAAMNVYKALEKEGYKFKFDPNMKRVKFDHDGNTYKGWESSNGESPVVELIHAPAREMTAGTHLTKDFFNKIKHYFPNTRASADLLAAARTGNFKSLRKLQTDLYTRAKKNLSSGLEADRMKGAEMLEDRNDINQIISNHLKNTGHHDLDLTLNEARDIWKTLQNTYYNENMNNALINMFDKNIRKIPNNLAKILTEESIPMQELLNFHPGLEEKVLGHLKGKNIFKRAAKYAIPSAAAVTGYEYGKKH
ncbi:MAG TPA: GNAT family N-acetyltransferase, partial [Aquella sp.]|nr:GNAT family N-acetyltransferase [Aquella sp.]